MVLTPILRRGGIVVFLGEVSVALGTVGRMESVVTWLPPRALPWVLLTVETESDEGTR